MKRRTLALILAAALTVTSVEGTAVMASAAEFTSEAAEEENTGQESETDTFSSDFAEQEGEIASEEIGITDEETQEEYLARRRREKEAKLQEKYERQEERARKRMNKKARGVTLDTQLPKKEETVKSVDVHEIVPDISVHDEYSADIYDPGDSFEYMQENVDDNIEEHIENDSYIASGFKNNRDYSSCYPDCGYCGYYGSAFCSRKI